MGNLRAIAFSSVLLASGCVSPNPDWVGDGPGSGGNGSGTVGTPLPAPYGTVGGDGGGGSGSAGGGVGTACYGEAVQLAAPIDDLAKAFQPGPGGNWLETALAVLERRLPGGHALLSMQMSDSQLSSFIDSSSFDALMESLYSVCSSETSIRDYDLATPSTFDYFQTATLTLYATVLATFPKSELIGYISDSATQDYDGTYLQGQQGQGDVTVLADDLASAVNGLACLAAVADHLQGGVGARDAADAQLYYLELYLKRARLAHPTVYAALKADPSWQKVVRYAWARVSFWAQTSAQLGGIAIADKPIWAHVTDPMSRMEIELFTGQSAAQVACSP
jgi:hypothetical protein